MNNEKNKLIKKLDKLISLIVRSEGKCYCCNSDLQLTAGHLITRNVYALRWDLNNVKCQCWKCNFLHKYRPEIYTAIFIKKEGVNKYLNLVKKSRKKIKITNDFLKKKIKELEKIYNKIISGAKNDKK